MLITLIRLLKNRHSVRFFRLPKCLWAKCQGSTDQHLNILSLSTDPVFVFSTCFFFFHFFIFLFIYVQYQTATRLAISLVTFRNILILRDGLVLELQVAVRLWIEMQQHPEHANPSLQCIGFLQVRKPTATHCLMIVSFRYMIALYSIIIILPWSGNVWKKQGRYLFDCGPRWCNYMVDH